jgi:hypothetical protein
VSADAAAWVARLWGDQPGHACLGLGHDGHFTDSGRYEFSRFEQRFYLWPTAAERLLDTALAAAGTADVYVGVLLRAKPSRRQGVALPGSVAWADVDGPWTPERQVALESLKHIGGVWQVDSGGGRHIYVTLGLTEPPDRLETWNRRLGALLDADSGWSETKVLRLPGTLNHKARARGSPSTPVRWIHEPQ